MYITQEQQEKNMRTGRNKIVISHEVEGEYIFLYTDDQDSHMVELPANDAGEVQTEWNFASMSLSEAIISIRSSYL